ncbi:type VII secretion target [Nocardia sp. XZ_19_385]|uniref:type VII secretion target n=1 Tax=Nocardia sp. XZ_19_385 TaxID=2769488 RepID=UPI001890B3B9|nr:type VII secretion target [Nocardia sp. XZ_19_385]
MAEQLNVDPDVLRALATSTDSVAEALGALEVKTAANAASSALPGADLAELCISSGEVTESAYRRMSNRCRTISGIAKGSANAFEVSDTEFQRRLNELGGS